MNLRKILTVAAIALFLAVSPSLAEPASAPAKKPNIVFILADDMGWTDLACFGSKYYESPNIDKLASQGMKFTSAYTCGPNCAPTRAALMSGQYQPRTGIYTVGGIDRFDWQSRPLRPVDNVTQLPLDKVTVADALKKNGYATAMFGKWHLGKNEYHPSKRGFDEAIESAGVHYDFKTDPDTKHPKDQYLADFLTEHAVDFIKRHKDGPFFLYLPHFDVHAPLQAKPEYIAKFKDKPGVGGHNNPTYAAMIYSVDESVGKIMATLDELGLAENTLVIFSSDNGGVGGYVREGIKEEGSDTTDNTPLRGGKGMLYEGGVRVPFIARWPGKISPETSSEQAIISVDLYPTFLEVAGAKPASGYTLDGVSILPTLLSVAPIQREALYWHFPGYLGAGNNHWRTLPGGAIRAGDYKLIEYFEDGRIELYNVKDDISQKHDLAKEKPELAKEMHEKLVAWRKETGAKMPAPNKDIHPPAKAKKGKAGED